MDWSKEFIESRIKAGGIDIPVGRAFFIESKPKDMSDVTHVCLDVLTKTNFDILILSLSGSPKNFLINYKRERLDTSKILLIDCSQKKANDPDIAQIFYADNISSLSSILEKTDAVVKLNGVKFILLDSVDLFLNKHNPQECVGFLSNLIAKMKTNGVNIFLLVTTDGNNQKEKNEIILLCDNVIAL